MFLSKVALFVLCAVMLASCKSYHKNASVEEAIKRAHETPKTTLTDPPTPVTPITTIKVGPNSVKGVTTMPPTDVPLGTVLRVNELYFKTGVELFDKTSLTLQSPGLPDVSLNPYSLDTPLKIEEGLTYNVVVELYLEDKLVYSSEFCGLNKKFIAVKNQNVFTINVCSQAVVTKKP